jgi:hypothetical protein
MNVIGAGVGRAQRSLSRQSGAHMASYSYLRGCNNSVPDPAPRDEDVLAAGKNLIPSLWFGLFTTADEYVSTISATNAAGDPITVNVYGLTASRERAHRTLLARRAHLFRFLPASLQVYFDKFASFISSNPHQCIYLDATEISLSSGDAEFRESVTKSLRACEVDDLDCLAELFESSPLSFDRATRSVKIAGREKLERSAPFLPVALSEISPPLGVGASLCGLSHSNRVPWTP